MSTGECNINNSQPMLNNYRGPSDEKQFETMELGYDYDFLNAVPPIC